MWPAIRSALKKPSRNQPRQNQSRIAIVTPDQESNSSVNDPLHGVTLKMIVNDLVEHFGWVELGQRINIKCFTNDPSLNSSLKFLRKTEWARQKVEALYLKTKWQQSLIDPDQVAK